MPKKPPSLRRKADRAVVTLADALTAQRRDYYTGPWGSAESVEMYTRLIRVWESSGRRLPPRPGEAQPGESSTTIGELLLACWRWVKAERLSAGETRAMKAAMKIVRELYAGTLAVEFTPHKLELIRDAMIARGWSRKSINRQVGRVRQVFKFGVSRGMVDVRVYDALRTLAPLRRGRSAARETKAIRPVPETSIEATLTHLSAPVAALVRAQLLTGARSGELCIMRPCDVDRSGKVWSYRPTEHKTAHHEHDRTIYIGPEAQRIVDPLLTNRPPDAFVFSPLDAQGRASTSARRTRYVPMTYRTAVARACDAAFPPPPELARQRVPSNGRKHKRAETTAEWRARLGEDGWESLQNWRREHRWHPHQLRHNAATRLRKEFGIELARIVLGHRSASITEVYAEADQSAAIKAMLKIG